MKNSPLTTVLLAALGISAVTSLILCWLYIGYAREFRQLNDNAGAINRRTAGINSLLNDALEYSKTHPAIDPLLESLRIKAPATNKAAAK